MPNSEGGKSTESRLSHQHIKNVFMPPSDSQFQWFCKPSHIHRPINIQLNMSKWDSRKTSSSELCAKAEHAVVVGTDCARHDGLNRARWKRKEGAENDSSRLTPHSWHFPLHATNRWIIVGSFAVLVKLLKKISFDGARGRATQFHNFVVFWLPT